jgi:hypothetical protein
MRGVRLIIFLASLAMLAGREACAQQSIFKEYLVKAIFLRNFTQFIEWPDTLFQDASSPLVIGVLGNDPFRDALEETIRDETVKNRPLVVKRSSRVEELKSCHVLFISKSEEGRLDQILAALAGGGGRVLTIGETDGFARRGVIINFFLQGNKVRFEINTDAADRSGHKISSHLLSLAKIVGTAKGKEHQYWQPRSE